MGWLARIAQYFPIPGHYLELKPGPARATVIIPTYGDALFARWAIKSVQQQTVRDLEICVICDGSPAKMVSLFRAMADDDPRVKVFIFPKSPRTGEPYRDVVIKQTTGKIICYCSHDDLWFPEHVLEMERSLAGCRFTHSLHGIVAPPGRIRNNNDLLMGVYRIDLNDPAIVERMLKGENFFGLTFGAHTRDGYFGLKEGWVTTPPQEIATDLYMWKKFLAAYDGGCSTVRKFTALNFRKFDRADWSERERDAELERYFPKLRHKSFRRTIARVGAAFKPPGAPAPAGTPPG